MTHSEDYINNLKDSFPKSGLNFLDGDTVVSPGSKDAVFQAAGSAISAIDGIENKKYKNAFCVVRPPGHHAEKNKSMGFCCISNAGVAVNYLIKKYNYKRIACVDFDVHWGNGNYDVMYDNKNSLYISTHQYPFYPGGGSEKDKGKYNNSLNIPLPAGTNSEEYFNAYDRVLDRLIEYKPDYLIFSAGFDAHKNDPLAQFEKGTKIIYYTGKIITKKQTENNPKFDNDKAIYLFNLNNRYDLDGDFAYNTARLINHSCDPNCEVEGKGLKLWISSIKDINKNEELTYDYGFSFDENYKDFPCKCGSKNCCGYIVREGSRWRIKKKKKKSNK